MPDIPLPAGLSMRPQRDSDALFVAALHASTRDDLLMVDGEEGLLEQLVEMQFRAQREGYGEQFPNAMYYIVESHGTAVGRVTVDFGANEVRLVDIALIRAARGKGYGTGIVRALQLAAHKAGAPLVLTVALDNPRAFRLYAGLGFSLLQQTETHAQMVWYPQAM